jgi:hypothetical protein
MINLKKLIATIGVVAGVFVSPALAMAATLTFNPASGVFNKGCDVSIKIDLDTQGVQTDGTDVIVTYNPAQLTTSTSAITNGTIYPEFPGNSVDSAAGKISISGISSVSSPYTGNGTFATIKFTVASTLAANTPISLNFDFDPNNKTKTTDTNVVERGTIADVLSAVTNGSYTVGTGSCSSGVTASPGSTSITGGQGQTGTLTGVNGTNGTSLSGTPSAQYQVYKPNLNDITGNGKGAGLLDNTLALTAVGILLVVLGVAGLAML